MLLAGPAQAAEIAVPSGQPVRFVELVREAPGVAEDTWRFRFVAPQIARDSGAVDADTALADIEALCSGYILPALEKFDTAPGQVIVSLADRETEFGKPAPEATQYFEAFRIEAGACIWEGF
jgi:hypothetical protein